MSADSGEPTSQLLERASLGDPQALTDVFERYRERLLLMVQLRMDRRLQGRIDASDVLQETFLEFEKSVPNYVRQPSASFYVWLRTITSRKLMALHRQHLGAQARDATREVSLQQGAGPQASSDSLANYILHQHSTPSHAAMREEMKARLQDALNQMDPLDCEVLALRHFEELSSAEAAEVLGIKRTAASNRYMRALERLKKILGDLSDI